MESTHQTELITISPKAAEKVMEFMKQENKDSLYLRVYVSGGGCSGASPGWRPWRNLIGVCSSEVSAFS